LSYFINLSGCPFLLDHYIFIVIEHAVVTRHKALSSGRGLGEGKSK